jgi:hypothetical protein
MAKTLTVARVFVVALAFAAPLRADLHYTIHTEVHPITPTEPVNPMFVMMGDTLIRMMFPDAATDSTYWVSDKGIRVELTKANAMMPAGSVLLHLADGTTLVMNPKENTYWKIALPTFPPQLLAGMPLVKPEISVVRTGEFETIAGIRAEHITSSIMMDLPGRPGVEAPPGMPTSISMSTDSWTSDQYANYAALAQATTGMMGLGALMPPGFTLKNVMRNSIMPGYEIESVVTNIAEEPAPADAFEIPADYKEVPAPARLGGGMSIGIGVEPISR